MTGTGNDLSDAACPDGPGLDGLALGPLACAVVEAARHVAGGEWGQAPRLYALATRAALDGLGESLPESVLSAPEDALIPVEQDPLADGDPADALAAIRWPADVAGCVLVTETVIDAGLVADADAGGTGPAGAAGRLAVGVLRDGTHACCLQLRGADELIVRPGLADDLVTALLGTLLGPRLGPGAAPARRCPHGRDPPVTATAAPLVTPGAATVQRCTKNRRYLDKSTYVDGSPSGVIEIRHPPDVLHCNFHEYLISNVACNTL
jgi:hypothetical protein